MQPIKIYQNLCLMETNEDALNAVLDKEVLCGILTVNFEKGKAEFHCINYHLNFECFGILVVTEKQEQIILIAGERTYVFSSNKPEYARYV